MECKRLFNSHWHDDWRRVGDVVIWCLDARRRDRVETDLRMEQVEAAIHDPVGGAGGEGIGGQKILKRVETRDKETKEPLRRVVEKPFWKARERVQAE